MNIKKWMYSKDTCSLTKHLFSLSCTWPQPSALHLWKGQLEPINEVCTENVFIFILSYLFIIDDLRGKIAFPKELYPSVFWAEFVIFLTISIMSQVIHN